MFTFSVVGAQLYYGDMLYIMVSFLILMWLIKVLAWKPITKMMKDRSDKIANDIDSAEKSKADASKLASQRQAELANTRQEATGSSMMQSKLVKSNTIKLLKMLTMMLLI